MDFPSTFDHIYQINPQARQALEEIMHVNSYSKNEVIQDIGSRQMLRLVREHGLHAIWLCGGTMQWLNSDQ